MGCTIPETVSFTPPSERHKGNTVSKASPRIGRPGNCTAIRIGGCCFVTVHACHGRCFGQSQGRRAVRLRRQIDPPWSPCMYERIWGQSEVLAERRRTRRKPAATRPAPHHLAVKPPYPEKCVSAKPGLHLRELLPRQAARPHESTDQLLLGATEQST